MRDRWTDDRLDDFRGEVNRRFDEASTETNRRFDEAAAETNRRFDEAAAETNRRFDVAAAETNRRFDAVELDIRELRMEMNSRFDGLQRTLLQIAGGTVATLIAGFAGVIATQL